MLNASCFRGEYNSLKYCYDNYEWLYRFKFTSFKQLFDSINNYINWYNTQRLHSTLGYITPLEMENKLRGIIKIAA